VQVRQFRDLYGLVPVGNVKEVNIQLYALTVARKIQHPAVATLVQTARRTFAGQSKAGR
jgi:hypothetical protein